MSDISDNSSSMVVISTYFNKNDLTGVWFPKHLKEIKINLVTILTRSQKEVLKSFLHEKNAETNG